MPNGVELLAYLADVCRIALLTREECEIKKLSTTQQWMRDHPDDVPCPRDPDSARAWRRKRGLEGPSPRNVEIQRKYDEAMREKRARQKDE
jgi:hypothetical protein